MKPALKLLFSACLILLLPACVGKQTRAIDPVENRYTDYKNHYSFIIPDGYTDLEPDSLENRYFFPDLIGEADDMIFFHKGMNLFMFAVAKDMGLNNQRDVSGILRRFEWKLNRDKRVKPSEYKNLRIRRTETDIQAEFYTTNLRFSGDVIIKFIPYRPTPDSDQYQALFIMGRADRIGSTKFKKEFESLMGSLQLNRLITNAAAVIKTPEPVMKKPASEPVQARQDQWSAAIQKKHPPTAAPDSATAGKNPPDLHKTANQPQDAEKPEARIKPLSPIHAKSLTAKEIPPRQTALSGTDQQGEKNRTGQFPKTKEGRARQLIEKKIMPQWLKDIAKTRSYVKNPPNAFYAGIWKRLDAETDISKEQIPRRLGYAKTRREDSANAVWLKWRILSNTADPRFSYIYSLYVSRKNEFQSMIFLYHARLSLAIDAARCSDRTALETIRYELEHKREFQQLIDRFNRRPGQDRAMAILIAAGLEYVLGERPPNPTICSKGSRTLMKAVIGGAKRKKLDTDDPRAKQHLFGSTYEVDTSGIEPGMISEERWLAKRREILDTAIRNASKDL